MKNSILTLFFLALFAANNIAQWTNVTLLPAYQSDVQQVLPLPDGNLLIVANRGLTMSLEYAAFIQVLTPSGEVVWEFDTSALYNEIIEIQEVFVEDNESILFAGLTRNCDSWPGWGFVFRLSMNGELLHQSPSPFSSQIRPIYGFEVDADGTIWCAAALGRIYQFSANLSELLTEIETGIESIEEELFYDIAILPDEQVIVSTDEKIYTVEMDGSWIGESFGTPAYEITRLNEDEILFNRGEDAVIFSNFLSAVAFHVPSDSIQQMKPTSTGFVAILEEDNQSYLATYDAALNPILTENISDFPHQVETIIEIENGFLIGGAETSFPEYEGGNLYYLPQEGKWAAYLQAVDNSLQINPTQADAALVAISPTTPFVEHDEEFASYYYDHLTVTVRNEGAAILNAVTVNMRHEDHNATGLGFLCGQSEFQTWTFEGLNLAPNETIMLELGGIEVLDQPRLDNDTPELCLWTSHPNFQLDNNHANDAHCDFFVATATEETVFSPKNCTVQPNPFSDAIHIQSSTSFIEDGEVILFNSLGKVVQKKAISRGQTDLILPTVELPKGMYWLIISQGQATECHSIVH